jgi:8-oxo-dGTP pyrophosphatase MutT (NUDIX family)
VEGGEYPREAAGRGATHLLGVPLITASVLGAALLPARDLLVVDHLDDETDTETLTEYVFDGGVVDLDHAQHFQAVATGTRRAEFVEPGEVATLVPPRLAQRIGAALTRLADPGAPVSIERGFQPGRGPDWEWRDGHRFPPGMPIRQVSVWAFDPDGRVLLQHRVAQHRFALPGGRPEPDDQSLIATAAREALEESQIVIDTDRAVVFGYQMTYQDPRFPDGLVQVRVAATIAAYLPIAPDADPQLGGARPAYRRYLVDVGRAAELLDFGPSCCLQADAAADVAREVLAVPVDRPAADGYRDHGDPPGAIGITVHPAELQQGPDGDEHTVTKNHAVFRLDGSHTGPDDER